MLGCKIVNTRKVLSEKYIDLTKKGFLGMKFCSYESNKESLLIVDFHPEISSNIYIDHLDCITENFEPINIKIIDSIDNNSSEEFYKWIEKSSENILNTKGVDMYFFKLDFTEYKPIMSLKGCKINKTFILDEKLNISVNFFAYSFSRENS